MNIFGELNVFDNGSINKDFLYIATISHNNPRYVEEFIRLNDKYIDNDKRFVIFDSSKDDIIANDIKNICVDKGVLYNRFSVNDCRLNEIQTKIGLKMNFIYNFYFKSMGIRYGGFLQSDFYYIKKIDILTYLKNFGYFGIILTDQSPNYLWQGNCFFDNEIYKDLNFLPNAWYSKEFVSCNDNEPTGECGVMNYKIVDNCYDFIFELSDSDWSDNIIIIPKEEIEEIDKIGYYQSYERSCKYKFNDYYIHAINGSSWDPYVSKYYLFKEEKMLSILEKY